MTYNFIAWVISIKVDTDDEHGGISRRRRDDDLLGTTLQVSRRPIDRNQYPAFIRSRNGGIVTHLSMVVNTPCTSEIHYTARHMKN